MAFKFGTQRSLGAGIGDVVAPIVGLKPQDVFAALVQPANTMQAAINALPFSPDLLIGKDRVAAGDWAWRDSGGGFAPSNATLASNTTAAQAPWPGFSGTNNRIEYAFKNQSKVIWRCDWTGDGTSNRQIPHGLGVVPGMIITKRLNAAAAWYVTHRALTQPLYDYLLFNSTGANNSGFAGLFVNGGTDASKITIGSDSAINASGGTYVAYIFAHDPSADGIVQCGSFTDSQTVTLGWRPQMMLIKLATAAQEWFIFDEARNSFGNALSPTNSQAEYNVGKVITPTATGFTTSAGGTYIYLAIRAPY